MRIHDANNLDFPDLLSRMGYEPVKVKKGGNDIWYSSPFRNEKDASFHIRKGRVYKWVWHDFGHEGGSTILDFIMQYKSTDKSGALAFLDTLYPTYKPSPFKDPNQSSFSFSKQRPPQAISLKTKPEESRDFEFIEALPLKSRTILNYLHSRRISSVIASKYFRLIKYRHKEKRTQKAYFGFGMQNESGGWEVRSASDAEGRKFKTALIAKDVSLIRGSKHLDLEVNIFEGMTDFVSFLSLFNVHQLKGDAIILHGLELYKRAATLIKEQGYTGINTFLDNNPPGQTTTQKVRDDFGSMVSNYSPNFAPYTDLNDALKAGYIPRFSSRPKPPHP